jgi:DNA replication protein DnaC
VGWCGIRTTAPGDAARIELLLAELRLPAVKLVWASLATQADKEGWPAGRFLAALAEHEIAERARRRLERHLAEARLPSGKTRSTTGPRRLADRGLNAMKMLTPPR